MRSVVEVRCRCCRSPLNSLTGYVGRVDYADRRGRVVRTDYFCRPCMRVAVQVYRRLGAEVLPAAPES